MPAARRTGLSPQFIRELAALLGAGVAFQDALTSLSRQHRGAAPMVRRLLDELKRGRGIGDAMDASGFLSRQDRYLVAAAEQAGTLDAAFATLAERHEKRQARQARLRARLSLSLFTAFLVLAIGAVIAVNSKGASVDTAILSALLQMVMIVAVVHGLRRLAALDAAAWLSWAWRAGLLQRSRRMSRVFEHYFYSVIAWQLEAGLPASDTLRNASGALDAASFEDTALACADRLAHGAGMHRTLTDAGLVLSHDLGTVIQAGEQAGRLAASIRHHLEQQQLHIDLDTDQLLAWIPRAAYVLVVLMAIGALPL